MTKDGVVSKSVALYSDADRSDATALFALLLGCFSLKIAGYNVICNDPILRKT